MRVLIVGDSQAAGPPGRSLEESLRQAGHETHRIGYSGHGAYDWTRMHWDEYQAALRTFLPEQVILVFGSNDPANASLSDAMERFKASSSSVWYAGPPQYASLPENQEVGRRIRAMASAVFGSRHLDAWPYTGLSTPRAADGLHFTASGGRAWAEGLLRDWTGRLRSAGNYVWIGPVVFGGLALVGVSLFLVSRYRRRRR